MFCWRRPLILRVLVRKFSTSDPPTPTSISELLAKKKPLGSRETVQGWLKAARKMGKNVFIDLNDGSSLESLQIVISKDLLRKPPNWGTSLSVTGKLQQTPAGQIEIVAEKVNVVGHLEINSNYPFTPKQKQSYDYYRQYLHLRPKINYFTSMLRFRNAASFRLNQYFQENGFINIHTPIITSSDCEGGGETFRIIPNSKDLVESMKKENEPVENAFFGSPSFLTVSGQLHLEAITRSISKVYTFNPSFRAENSRSRLHLSEFYMVEAEEAFVSSLNDVLLRIEDCMKQVISFLLSKHLNEIEFMLDHSKTDTKSHIEMLEKLISQKFLLMTFSDAKALINKNIDKIKKSTVSSHSLTKEEEIFLVEYNNNLPVFVIDWPSEGKPFYMKSSEENPQLVKGVDLLVPNVGELCGGSLREDNHAILEKKLKDLNLLSCMQWYVDLRKHGSVPTGGFGLGFERFLQFFLNVQNIKDTIPFPRWPHGLQL